MKFNRLTIIASAAVAALLLVAVLVVNSGNDTSDASPKKAISTIDVDSSGKPTNQAFINAISQQAYQTGFTDIKKSADLVSRVDSLGNGYYVVTLLVPNADNDTTMAAVRYTTKPGALKLLAGPTNYFDTAKLTQQGVPNNIAADYGARSKSGE